MKRFFNSEIITTGLAIFSMFFGAGNLMYPIRVGSSAGDANPWAIAGFLITATLFPLIGLIAIILFQGDYARFFYRLGKIPGFFLILFCLSIAGPLIAMPRIVALSYTVIAPFFPGLSLFFFSIIFLFCTFLATYKESKIVDLLGYVISPLLLISLVIIIIKGYFSPSLGVTTTTQAPLEMFWKNFIYGYETLDLLGGIFFSSIVITILQKNFATLGSSDFKKLALMSLKSGIIGVSLLGLVYLGLSYLGVYFGHGLEHINEGELFSAVSFRILGPHGAAIIALAVLMACFSTIIALTAINSEFINKQIFKGKIGYINSIIIVLLLTLIPSNLGLGPILEFSRPIITIAYPALIVLTLVNIAYKLFNFKLVKIPVAITLIISCIAYFI
ncbi:MAG: branched-chain amino acid transport system II carrier protein [Candidatus Babeliales bacterium]